MLTLQERDRWVAVLNHLVQQVKEQRAYFNEKEWILKKFREADTNKNGILTFSKRFRYRIQFVFFRYAHIQRGVGPVEEDEPSD